MSRNLREEESRISNLEEQVDATAPMQAATAPMQAATAPMQAATAPMQAATAGLAPPPLPPLPQTHGYPALPAFPPSFLHSQLYGPMQAATAGLAPPPLPQTHGYPTLTAFPPSLLHSQLYGPMQAATAGLAPPPLPPLPQTLSQIFWTLSQKNDVDGMRNLISRPEARELIENSACIGNAIRGRHTSAVELLLETGVNLETCRFQGQSLLNTAVTYNANEVVHLLLRKGANPNESDTRNDPILRTAIIHSNQQVIEMLLHFGANSSTCDSNGETSLHIATLEGNTNVVRLLLDIDKSRKYIEQTKSLKLVNKFNSHGETALNIAARDGNTEIVKLLIDGGAFINDFNGQGKTSLHIAYEAGNQQVVDLLYQSGARGELKPISQQNLREWDIEYGDPLTEQEAAKPELVFLQAVGTGNIVLLRDLLVYPELVEGDDNYRDPSSTEPDNRRSCDIEASVEDKAFRNLNQIKEHKFNGDRTALHVLAQNIIPDDGLTFSVARIADLLTQHGRGVAVEERNALGRTALQDAVIQGNISLIEHLINLGADPNAYFNSGGPDIIPLEYLIYCNKKDLFDIFVNILKETNHLKKAVILSGKEAIKFATDNSLACKNLLTETKALIDSEELANASAPDIHADGEEDDMRPLEHDDSTLVSDSSAEAGPSVIGQLQTLGNSSTMEDVD